jgi:hypothetical protein
MLLGNEPGCALYVGGVSGNDREMSVRLELCAAPSGLVGTIQYVSAVSGWSVRRVAGAGTANGQLLLADTMFVESHPSVDWAYCLVDQYALRMVGPGSVEGEYFSSQCRDRAKIALERVE